MNVPALRIADLAKRFAAHVVLAGVSLELRAGESFGLIGANGTGKTTLLRILLDLDQADRGRIEIFGADHRQAAARQRIAFLPERFTPVPFATGAEFLRLLCRLHAVAFDAVAVQSLCQELLLDPQALRQRLAGYSKGMAQKLGVLACLLVRPDLLVLDEPMSGLDPRSRASVRRLLLAERARGGTLFCTTHQLQDLDELCDRFAVLHGGHLVFTGTAAEFRGAFGADDLEQAYLAACGS